MSSVSSIGWIWDASTGGRIWRRSSPLHLCCYHERYWVQRTLQQVGPTLLPQNEHGSISAMCGRSAYRWNGGRPSITLHSFRRSRIFCGFCYCLCWVPWWLRHGQCRITSSGVSSPIKHFQWVSSSITTALWGRWPHRIPLKTNPKLVLTARKQSFSRHLWQGLLKTESIQVQL